MCGCSPIRTRRVRLPPAAPLFSNALPSVSEVRTGQLAAGTCAGLLRRRSSGKALTVEKRGRGEAWCRVIQRHPGRREGCDSSHSTQSIQSDPLIKVIYEECKSESAIQKFLMRAQLSTSPVRDRALRGASFQSHLCPAGQPPTPPAPPLLAQHTPRFPAWAWGPLQASEPSLCLEGTLGQFGTALGNSFPE